MKRLFPWPQLENTLTICFLGFFLESALKGRLRAFKRAWFVNMKSKQSRVAIFTLNNL